MKLIPSLFFIAVGIWVTYNHPDVAKQAYFYIEIAVAWAVQMLNDFKRA
ncbi:hypothetical protein [Pseudoalteromonas rubra]|nr:hypothetical protein [Pseudoalteromonas rubra]